MKTKVVLVGAGISDPDLSAWDRNYMRYDRLHMPLEGRAIYREVKENRVLYEGRAYLLVHSYSPNFEMVPRYPYRHMYIDFRTIPPFLNRDTVEIDLSEDPFALYLLKAVQTLLQETARNQKRDHLYVRSDSHQVEQIKRILSPLLEHFQQRYGVQVVDNPKIGAALRFIDEHYAEPLRNEDIADALHIDKRSLIRLFGKYMNMSPWQYLTQYRVEVAIECLRSGKSVTETAFLCGYQSEASLRLAFKRVLGCTPKAILKQ